MDNNENNSTSTEQQNDTYAAIDLGSNSFHMVVARETNGSLVIIDRIKNMVRIAGGLDENKQLTDEAQAIAVDCLQKFGQRIAGLDDDKIRAVGTNTLRQAKNSDRVIGRLEKALGHSIDIISGREEARLIYIGVSKHDKQTQGKQLVIDIGGGSTEFALGVGIEPMLTESLYMGCVSASKRFFDKGEISKKAFAKAELFAMQKLEAMTPVYKRYGWDSVIGTSGTILAAASVCDAMGWSKKGLSLDGLYDCRQQMLKDGHIDNLFCADMIKQRTPVFPGGVAILIAIFEALEIDCIDTSDSALREGLLYELYGRLHHQDSRETTIRNLSQRFDVDQVQADEVTSTAMMLHQQISDNWKLRKQKYINLLRWAAQLHEVGLSVAHSKHQKHAGYLLANADLAGFSRQEQEALAVVVQSHRGKIDLNAINALTNWKSKRIQRLIIILRIAVVLHRSRIANALPQITVKTEGDTLRIDFPEGWLEQHPLTEADLENEASYQGKAGYQLKYGIE